jgi:hypothetical protein
MTGIFRTWVPCMSGAGLVIVEQTALEAEGRISHRRQGPRPEAEELLEVLATIAGSSPNRSSLAMARTKAKAGSR